MRRRSSMKMTGGHRGQAISGPRKKKKKKKTRKWEEERKRRNQNADLAGKIDRRRSGPVIWKSS